MFRFRSSSQFGKITKPSRRQRRAARSATWPTFRPRREVLEDRTLPSATLPVSVASSGTQMGNGSASINPPAVSANGQYEVFTSNASDVVNGVIINPNQSSGPGSGYHVYWHNLSNGATAMVDVDINNPNESGNYSARYPSITPDGRYVAFVGYENDLTANAASASQPQIYVRDMQANQTYLVSLGIDDKPENGGPNQTPTPSITQDGNGHLLIAYQSNATNLTANDTSSSQQIFLASLNLDSSGDIEYGSLKTTLVSADNSGSGGNGDSLNPVLSADGSTIVYDSPATDLASGVTLATDSSGNPIVPQAYAYLSKPSAPAITGQPSNQTVTAGQTAAFTVTASGSPPAMIQWQVSTDGGKTFSNISGASSTTLTLSNVQVSQNGNEYQAVLSNIYGTITTNTVTLTVNPIPVPPAPPAPPPPVSLSPPPSSNPPPPPVLNVPPLLAFFDAILGGIETLNSNGTETITDSIFGIPLLVSTFDRTGKLTSITVFGIDVTLLFELL